jgi:MarR family transcriptional regulator, transcriptional regulator for hemolysin
VLKYDFEESVGYWLCSAQHSFMVALRDKLAPHNITYRQTEILGWLALEGPLSQADLANRMMIEPPSLVGTLDRMEASGLLVRKSCPDDRRKNLVQPLPAAERVWEQIASCAREVRAQATQGFTEEETAILKKLLSRLRDNFAVLEPVESAP